ncbi:MAG: hypothetical protein SXV54_02450 [Chloroflexota bacterium]|nr:hypothetical protein [Chloroflexota bacterium]
MRLGDKDLARGCAPCGDFYASRQSYFLGRNYPATPPNSKPDDAELALTPSPSPPPNPSTLLRAGSGGEAGEGVGTGQSIRATAQAGAAWA